MAIAEPQLSPAERYRPAARALHWLIALLVLVVWPFGMVIEFIKDDTKLVFYLVHESLGFLVLWLMLARLAVRLIFPPPPHPPMPALQARVATIVHILLYVALIAQPLIGFLATNALGFPLDWFGLVTVWSPLGKSDIGWTLLGIHEVLGWSILVLFVMHFGGVLHHHVIRRDPTLYRMV
ncbi:cytochrome b [Jiella marina]|uniref:cytochrome b n=1 Tax=Jiella sp. LLJ827 TaxID=2917712 RepID=UPI0021011569|nr:cytochrome b/b6 domain-containing protein [Jiella sp. LLJ827]MCQ0989404.1 cytochrome b/b6 domain-containing protein [Jiella sp. LLJ827]